MGDILNAMVEAVTKLPKSNIHQVEVAYGLLKAYFGEKTLDDFAKAARDIPYESGVEPEIPINVARLMDNAAELLRPLAASLVQAVVQNNPLEANVYESMRRTNKTELGWLISAILRSARLSTDEEILTSYNKAIEAAREQGL